MSCCWAFAGVPGFQGLTTVGAADDKFGLSGPIEVYDDKDGSETIDTVQSRHFRLDARSAPNFGRSRSVYWFRLSKTNPGPGPGTLYLNIQNQWLDSIDVFVRSGEKDQFERYRAGAKGGTSDKAPGDLGPVFRLRFAPQETKTVFVRVQSGTAIRVPIFLLTEEAYRRERLDSFFVLGLFYGILGFLLIYNVFAWYILKQKAYIYYNLLLMSVCFFQLAWDDLVPHVSIFSAPDTLLHVFTSGFALARVWNLLFVSSFMDARDRYPIMYRLFDILTVIAVALFILYQVNFYMGNYLMVTFAPVLACVFTVTLGLMWYLGQTQARYLFLAHAPAPVFAAVLGGLLVGSVPYHSYVTHVAKLAYVWQWIFFSLALADRFSLMQRNFTNLLEGRVAERSAELLAANEGLQSEIRERKRTEESLIRAKAEAESATRAKTVFLANMSHEIRTPLNAILGMTDLMLDSDLAAHQRERTEIVRSAADKLLVLVNDALDFSKIEAGKMDLEEIDFDVRSILWDIEALFAERVRSKGLRWELSVRDDVPQFLRGDPGRLRQVLLNLVGNALKFTDEGEICIQAELRDRSADEVVLCFTVADTGIGIPPDKLNVVFERFSQVDSSTTRKYGGTGLGLAIASQLSKALGGEMRAESELGKGSLFHFTARFRPGRPVAPVFTSTAEPTGTSVSLRGMKVLLAEDNPFNQAVAVEVLRRQGCRVVVASTGGEAVEAFNTDRFDVVLMDVEMPEIDGFEATRMIRAKETSTRVPIIAQTAHAFAADRERCLAAGMDEHISKPINVNELVRLLGRFSVLRSRGREEGSGACTNTPAHGPSEADRKVFDMEALLDRLGGDLEAAREMADLFFSDLPELTANVGSAALERDWELLARHAHALKGASGNFGALGLAALATELETCAGVRGNCELQGLEQRLDLEIAALKEAVTKAGLWDLS